jgi:hypothetical protein
MTETPTSGQPAGTNRTFRRNGRWLETAGLILAGAGSLAVLVGGVLPWARFVVFGVPVSLPGVAAGGALAAMLGILGFVNARRPLLTMLLGIACFVIGGAANREVGQAVRRHILRAELTLAPMNDRLARVALPPLEPFQGIGAANSYVGPGPLWTLFGGAGMALGGALRFAGGRQARLCRNCGALWSAGREVHFCPRCGASAAEPGEGCPSCQRPLAPGDKFCVHCGTAAAS